MISKGQLIERLLEIEKKYMIDHRLGGAGTDPEVAHIKADEAILEYINDPTVSELHGRLAVWYA